ncbi:flagellar basal body P-ring formation chaperone FlgA [Zavarzinia sp.]|uniref:flagellar basal body P-ring formation chaperone FlgA n=1 Tax=Zavarzinia sp. TaxID=2027920 RepID=UPI003BB71D67|nr:flagellar basal body P-ring formation chaperone FlgA [Zavarzinia sp.]
MIRFAIGMMLWLLAFGLAIPVRAEDAGTIVPVLLRDIATGEVLNADDLTDGAIATALPANTAESADQLVGMAARKPLRAGRPVSLSEVRRPILVNKGSLLTVRVSMPGIELSTTAKAIEQGAMGEVIRVMNLTSNRVVQAVVSGAGEAVVPVAAQPVM